MSRLAVLVGIDHYAKSPLKGCVRDAQRMHQVLARHVDLSPNFDCKTFVSSPEGQQIDRAFLRRQFEILFAKKVDVALFYFAGHGALTRNRGALMATQELATYDQGVPLFELIGALKNSPAQEKIVIIDSCYSGSFGDMPSLADNVAIIPDDVAILVACRDYETAAESENGGLLTSLLVSALEGAAADVRGKVTIADAYSYASAVLSGWQQRPLYKANVSQMLSLRNCEPTVPDTVLRRLPQLFTAADVDMPLDPAYEPTSKLGDLEKEEKFKMLQQLRDARLLVPRGASALYYAAVESKACALTPLGRFYWELANAGRI
jgi:hypothetical protein